MNKEQIERNPIDAQGMVLEIQRMSTEDGPGLRTSVFLKGCSLRCKWCHNPESISAKQDVQWRFNHCIGCRLCIETMDEGIFHFENGKLTIDRSIKADYNAAVNECPSGALELIGEKWNASALVKEILKDRAYFNANKDGVSGGVTISGGEPVLQDTFVREVFRQLKSEGVHTTLDTCGMVSLSKLQNVLSYVDLILFDIKETDSEKHKIDTGSSNEVIFKNLEYINEYIKTHKEKKLWIRTPIIPDTTGTEENIRSIACYLKKHRINFERWELCSFNNLCNDKYERLNLKWEYKNYVLLERSFMDHLLDAAKEDSHIPERIIWTGSVKESDQDLYNNKEKNPIKAVNYCKITAIPT